MKPVLALAFALSLVACKKEKKAEPAADKPAATATPNTGTVNADGVRVVAIEASEKGYVPDRIPGKPGEKLKLKFTRTVDAEECLGKLKTPDGKIVVLPKDTPVDVDVTVPADGEIKFACGMEMFFAVVVAEKA